MLMMVGVLGGAVLKPGPADAHDAGGLGCPGVKAGPADARDAQGLGVSGVPWKSQVQLMRMLLVQLRQGVCL